MAHDVLAPAMASWNERPTHCQRHHRDAVDGETEGVHNEQEGADQRDRQRGASVIKGATGSTEQKTIQDGPAPRLQRNSDAFDRSLTETQIDASCRGSREQ
jgi:hypothetical protein